MCRWPAASSIFIAQGQETVVEAEMNATVESLWHRTAKEHMQEGGGHKRGWARVQQLSSKGGKKEK